MVRRRLLLGLLVLVLVVVAGGAVWWHDRGSVFARATALAPAGTERISWTDWAQARESVHADLSADSGERDLSAFLDKAYDADLSSASAMLGSARELQRAYGFSPATADWELFAQSAQGATLLVRLPDSTDFGAIGNDLEDVGYTRPSADDGVWLGGADVLAGDRVTPELDYVVLDEADHLVVTSDSPTYVQVALAAVRGDGDRVTGLDQAVGAVDGDPVSAEVYAGSYACGALAMAHADAGDQREGADLLAQAGQVNPYSAFVMAMTTDRRIQVEMSFDSGDTARTNADTRARLAQGPAPGQGGSFGSRFTVESVKARGDVVSMDLRARPRAYVLSDLSNGPLLFATC